MSDPAATIEALRSMGERVTPARRAVIEVLEEADGHLDADTISARVADREPGVHRATVYRTLQSLCDVGLLEHTHVPGSATIYHVAVGGHGQHAHMQCVVCRKVFDLPTAWVAELADRVAVSTGFVIDPEHAALLGTCPDCRLGPDS